MIFAGAPTRVGCPVIGAPTPRRSSHRCGRTPDRLDATFAAAAVEKLATENGRLRDTRSKTTSPEVPPLLRELTIDPTRDYQPQKPQNPSRRRGKCERCRATSHGGVFTQLDFLFEFAGLRAGPRGLAHVFVKTVHTPIAVVPVRPIRCGRFRAGRCDAPPVTAERYAVRSQLVAVWAVCGLVGAASGALPVFQHIASVVVEVHESSS